MKKLKKILTALITAAVSAVSFCSMFTASALGSVDEETYRIYVDVPVNSGISETCLNLRYDPIIADVCKYYKGTLNNECYVSALIDNEIGYYGIDAYYESSSNLTASGTLGVITMIAPSSINSIFDVVDLNIEYICNTAGTFLPTSRLRINDVMVGDVNQDGKVNTADATLLNNYLNGKASLSGNALRAADTNADFGVTKDDLTHLNDYLSGKVSYFDA